MSGSEMDGLRTYRQIRSAEIAEIAEGWRATEGGTLARFVNVHLSANGFYWDAQLTDDQNRFEFNLVCDRVLDAVRSVDPGRTL